jgi:broad specificity phosphatase PhoE
MMTLTRVSLIVLLLCSHEQWTRGLLFFAIDFLHARRAFSQWPACFSACCRCHFPKSTMTRLWHFSSLSLFLLLVSIISAEMTGETASTTKTVYLIRHAESEENRRIASLGRCFKQLGKFSLPSSSDIYASTQLLNVPAQIDSGVSEIGMRQITYMGEKLKEANFLHASAIKLVAHSPLLRAQETSEGMLGCRANATKADSVDRVVELELLIEKTPQEWTPMYFSTFKKRIASFEDWLGEQPEDRIAIVGHSQFFKAMLGLDFKFGNCDVWELNFDLSKRDSDELVDEKKTKDATESSEYKVPPQWSDLKQLYVCDVIPSSKQE